MRKKPRPCGSKNRSKRSRTKPLRKRGKMIQPASSSIPSSPTRMKASPHGTPNKSPPETPTRMKASPSRVKASPSYSDKKRHSTPQITPKREKVPYNVTPNCSSGLEMSPRKDYVVGQDVLARWTDGLFYLGTVKKVDEKLGRCYILFEDQSSFWVMFKDMMGSPNYNTELTCTLCSDGTSEEPNQIVICDRCGQGYHQLCHQPPILDSVLEPEVQWLCRQCIFANSVKRGGALKKGPNAKALQQMKLALPYETVPGCHALSPINLYTALLSQMNMTSQLTSLSWDSAHRTNKQECYCYCGGPGDWYLKMLQCSRCRQWFHEACVQCLEKPMLYGDRFYLFVCSVCNAGPEYLQRMEMKWVDLAQLVLYNLSLTNKKKYQDFDNEIMPFINNNWDNLQLVRLEAFTRGERQEKVLDALRASKTRFACGKEVKKRKSIFGLRIRTPPVPPTIILPLDGPINEVTMNDLEMKGRKVKTFVPAQRLSESPVPLNRKRSLDLDDSDMDTKAKRARKLLEAAKTTLRVKSPKSANQSYTGYGGRLYGDNGLPSTSSLLDSIPHCDEATFDNLSSNRSVGSSSAPSVSESTVSSCSSIPPSAGSSYLVASRHHPSTSPSNRRSLSPKGKKPNKRGRPKKNVEKKFKSTGRKRGRPSKKELYVETSSESEDESIVEPEVIKSMKDTAISMEHLRASVNSYFGAEGRLACGEKYTVLARRVTPDGKVQYLVQWEGFTPDGRT
ncbi:metal-response element-binding transcription factor 2-like isoform X1 [Branchiostoma floridae]|uniref:Metal-response element-binding transcription factor 2-like isoform X1 n=2 Tax=Branchiostoma floridae TaxID=7739 RepID=A0A9J7LJE4_BRAFL|nr:metal-response element-binding transcription factor 2-like isoform X1 [Branchiostoma floridae]